MMDLEIIILSEVRLRQVSLVLYTEYYICVCVHILYTESKKKSMKYIYKTETENELMVTRGQRWRNRLGV